MSVSPGRDGRIGCFLSRAVGGVGENRAYFYFNLDCLFVLSIRLIIYLNIIFYYSKLDGLFYHPVYINSQTWLSLLPGLHRRTRCVGRRKADPKIIITYRQRCCTSRGLLLKNQQDDSSLSGAKRDACGFSILQTHALTWGICRSRSDD